MSTDTEQASFVSLRGQRGRVSVVGELDAYSAPAFVASFVEELGNLTGKRVEIDCSLLSFVDASGLSALIVVARHARNVGLEFGIAATGESLQRLLDLCSVREF